MMDFTATIKVRNQPFALVFFVFRDALEANRGITRIRDNGKDFS